MAASLTGSSEGTTEGTSAGSSAAAGSLVRSLVVPQVPSLLGRWTLDPYVEASDTRKNNEKIKLTGL